MNPKKKRFARRLAMFAAVVALAAASVPVFGSMTASSTPTPNASPADSATPADCTSLAAPAAAKPVCCQAARAVAAPDSPERSAP